MDHREINRALWNARAPVHVNSRFYDVAGFLKGGCSLPEIDVATVGDVSKRRLLHLQCHFGLDSLSWARRGALVTGVDLSDQSIEHACRLAEKSGLDANFVACDVYETKSYVKEQFDVVFTSWGALVWLPELKSWAEMVRSVTAPGAVVHVNEFHPVIYMLGDDGELKYAYFGQPEGYDEIEKGTYTDGGEGLGEMRSMTWNHSMADVIQSLIEVGFQLDSFQEYDFSPYPCFDDMVEDKPGEWIIKKLGRRFPYAYSMKFK